MINKQALIPTVIVAKPTSTAKADLEVMAKWVAQLTTKAVPNNLLIEDIIITFTGSKDVEKRIKSLTDHKEIKVVLIYSAKQIFTTKEECYEFIATMADFYKIKVICYR